MIEIFKRKSSYSSSETNNFEKILSKTDIKIIYDNCSYDNFFKKEIVKYYTAILFIWDGKESQNENYLKRIEAVFNIDKNNLDYIDLRYLLKDYYKDLDELYDFDYNSERIQGFFQTCYDDFLKAKSNELKNKGYLTTKKKEDCFNRIRRAVEHERFSSSYDASKWKNKKIVEIINPIVYFDTDFDLSELKDLFSKGDVEGVDKYCSNNKEKLKNTLKHNGDEDFFKMLNIIARTTK